MANITVVSTTNAIKVDFGDYAPSVGISKGTWPKALIGPIELADGAVIVETSNASRWTLSTGGDALAMIVDTIDGVAPTSNEDLQQKLSALIE